jgi:cell division protein ZipA
MIIIGVLLIVAVLLDGYRRVRSERRNRIRVTLTKQAMQRGLHGSPAPADIDEKPPEVSAELPNGGARVIAKARRDDLHSRGEKLREDLKLDEPVPVLMESVHIAPLPVEPEPEPEPELEPEEMLTARAIAEPEIEPDDVVQAPAEDIGDRRIEPSYRAEVAEPAANKREQDAEPVPQETRYFESRTLQNSALPNSAAQEVMVVNVISKDAAGFKGQDLLQILLACDLRFGNMNIFHRYEKANGKGAVQFSVANLVEPGTFDLDRIDSFSTPGLCFFLALPGPEKAITAFNYMVETAQVLVKNLHGELRDEGQSVMTQQTIEHCRQRIRDFERKQLTLHL